MPTAAQIKQERARHRRELAAMLKEKDAKRLATLRADLARARDRKQKALVKAREACRANRVAVSESARERRAQLNAAIAAERAAAKGSCSVARSEAREGGKRDVEKVRRELAAEQATLRTERIYRKPPRLGASQSTGKGARRAAELRAESDSEVRANLEPSLIPVWEKIKRHIRPTGRATRTEAFLQFLHDNPQVVWEVQEADAARELRRLEREEREHRRSMAAPKRYKRSPEELAASLADVPF